MKKYTKYTNYLNKFFTDKNSIYMIKRFRGGPKNTYKVVDIRGRDGDFYLQNSLELACDFNSETIIEIDACIAKLLFL